MNDYLIERYYSFNTKGCIDEICFGHFHDQPIPPNYYNFLCDNNDDDNNNPGTPIDNIFLDNKRLYCTVITQTLDSGDDDENNEDDLVIDDADSLTSAIDSLQDEFL